MNVSSSTNWIGFAGIALLVIGFTVSIAWLLLVPTSPARSLWRKYETKLEADTKFLMMKTSGRQIARLQLTAAAFVIGVAVITKLMFILTLLIVIAFLPVAMIERKRVERSNRIEQQIEAWLLFLANGLRAAPSIGEALSSSAKLLRPPISEELDLVIKELQLGSPVDQALIAMGNRAKSRTVSSALAVILVGRQTGGDLPAILEESSATLREMIRLEGVVKSKTADARWQSYVLGLMPFVITGGVQYMAPHYFEPLLESGTGYAIVGTAIVLWVVALIAARKIGSPDI